jgi:hypothetical protein
MPSITALLKLKIARKLAKLHAESPEVRAAGGASPDDSCDFDRNVLARDLRDAGLPCDAEACEQLRDCVREAIEEIIRRQTMSDFEPSHKITLGTGEEVLVSLCSEDNTPSDHPGCAGPAYTEQEWRTCTNADYERNSDGTWTFQGQPFAGMVSRLD